ncbi:MAG: hypothetical protein AAF570_28680, partial [Bacteroidota bacterium]
VRNLVLEAGAAEAWLVNQFLQSGDTNLLSGLPVREGMPKRMASWEMLREWNETLPDTQRIACIGVDHEHPDAIKKMLPLVLQNEADAPSMVRRTVAELRAHLRNHHELREDKRIRALHRFLPHFEMKLAHQRGIFTEFMGDRYQNLLDVASNSAANNHDRYMAVNLQYFAEKLDTTAKFLVICGTGHLSKSWEPGPKLGWFLHKQSMFAGKVFASAMVYEDANRKSRNGHDGTVVAGDLGKKRYFRKRSTCLLSNSSGEATLIVPDPEEGYWHRITKQCDALIVVRKAELPSTAGL